MNTSEVKPASAVFDREIVSPQAWRADEVTKEDFVRPVGSRQAAALRGLVEALADRQLTEISPELCRHADLEAEMQGLFGEIQHGRGMVILRGLPMQGLTDEEVGKMFWILGTFLGTGVSQSVLGNVLGYVRDETAPGAKRSARGYIGNGELALHTDFAHIMGLACVRKARSGGVSSFASALSVHNDFLRERPDLLPLLYRGWPLHRRGEEQPGQPPVTPYHVPIFCNVGGTVSCLYNPSLIDVTMRELAWECTPDEIDALALLRKFSLRNSFDFQLEPGEAVLCNNLTSLHARTEFVDWDNPAEKRLMIRLWLDANRDVRPFVPQLRRYDNKDGRSGIDPVAGRRPAESKFLMA